MSPHILPMFGIFMAFCGFLLRFCGSEWYFVWRSVALCGSLCRFAPFCVLYLGKINATIK